MQNVLNETQMYLSRVIGDELITVTNSAFSQAKSKLNYTAFVELSNDLSSMFYDSFDVKFHNVLPFFKSNSLKLFR